ncbi:hypothetical protein ACNSOP_09995 [Aliarcobacter lanthieri]|uniref:hypothetical protein n=1 Tax=Aliarcobacter lanthieri TaxID=1355374 RepID=UPI0019228BA9|nr:hypothetical protein [Aliarcobacter lanthieri]MBL3520049.1 hypothetical protein [Aliarcobacter lanthieri]
MIIIGDNLVPYEEIFFISRIEEIKNTKPNSILVFNYDEAIVKYCFQNSLNFAVVVENLKEAIYANSLNAKYIISKIKLAKKIQKVAENYMFDSKILAIIDSNDELENIAKKEIDGIIYRKLLA